MENNIFDINFDFKNLDFALANLLNDVINVEETLKFDKEQFNEFSKILKESTNPYRKTDALQMLKSISFKANKYIDEFYFSISRAKKLAKMNLAMVDVRINIVADRFNTGGFADQYENKVELDKLKDGRSKLQDVLDELEMLKGRHNKEDFVVYPPNSEKGD